MKCTRARSASKNNRAVGGSLPSSLFCLVERGGRSTLEALWNNHHVKKTHMSKFAH